MANKVGLRELRQQTSHVMKRVAAGEVVEVTDHGHPIARIVPLRPGTLEQLVLDGAATGAKGYLLDVMDELGLPAPSGGPLLPSGALAKARAEER
ncbi:MAG: type II toxin-antitoxin system Phd/YefM family antitoxin [Acidimicrobiales bacterium]